MFQSYKARPPAAKIPERLAKLRRELTKARIDAYLVPRGDEHRGEYVPTSAERLAWLTGFTGSAGLAIVTKKNAALFVDGRYTVQARAQVPAGHIEVFESPIKTIEAWIAEWFKDTSLTIGFDPWLHSVDEIDRLKRKLSPFGVRLKSHSRNLVDRVWSDRPTEPLGPVVVQPLAKSGESSRDKVARLQRALVDAHEDATILTAPESICWLLNIRGSDVAHNPIVLSYAILPARGKVELFIETEKLNSEVRSHLAPVAKIYAATIPESAVRRTPLRTSKSFADRLQALKQAQKTVRIDTSTCPVAIARRLGPSHYLASGPDPCALPRATKNATELRGARAAHKRDAVAVCRFLAWLDRQSPTGEVDEITAARQLEQFRRDTNQLREISFDTISGSGPNGAIVHYRVTTNTNRVLNPGELYLVDSGAQYQDGTTDITRTVAVGTPTEEMCDR
ncbi:MAG: aminopeptidase P family N-terminal domain-containing protein, partial [Hyphomicrobiaceae bacterium]